MPEMKTHPTAQTLALFGHGKLPEAQAAAIAAHLETCAGCRQAVASLPADSFLGKVRAARPGVSSIPPGRAGASQSAASRPAEDVRPPGDVPPELANHPKFRVVRELGRGGMGIVYLAEHRVMEKPVALKVISPAVLDNPDAVARFLSEARAAGKLDHPHIARAYDADQAGNLYFLVLEYVEGSSLARLLERHGPLSVANACQCVRQAALALQHAFEQGMVHRDIKPHNLMLTPKGQIKVLDFGLARMRGERKASPRLTQLQSFMGTPEYVAPEQATDARSADIRADIYSLGCTLYVLLTGRPPFVEDSTVKIVLAHIEKEPRPVHELRPEVPATLSAIVARMLAKDPSQRFQRPIEVVQALASFGKAGPKPHVSSSGPVAPPLASAGTGTRIGGDTSQVKRLGVPAPKSVGQLRPVTNAIEGGSPFAGLGDAPAGDPIGAGKQTKDATRPVWKRPAVLAGVGVAGLLLAVAILWSAGVFRVKMPDGSVLVLEVNEPGAIVSVDGHKIEVDWADGGKKAEIRADPDKQKVEVRKDGFTVAGQSVEIKDGKRVMRVALVRPPAKGPAPDPGGGQDKGEPSRADAPPVKPEDTGKHEEPAPRKGDTPPAVGNGSTAPAPPKPQQDRSLWVHRRGSFTKGHGKDWTERIDQATNEFREINRTPEYVELENKTAPVWVRLHDSACLVRAGDGPFAEFYRGKWNPCTNLPTAKGEGPGASAASGNDGFVPVFNGSDLTGWQTHPDHQTEWCVREGALVSARAGRLFTSRDNLTDFCLQAEVLLEAGTVGALQFRSDMQPQGADKTYAVVLHARTEDTATIARAYQLEHHINSGSVIARAGGFERARVLCEAKGSPLQPNQWYSLEVIATGWHFVVKIGGQVVADAIDDGQEYSQGRIALQRSNTVQENLHFRNIRVKKLPTTETEPAPAEAPVPRDNGFAPLFNSKDLTGWRVEGKGRWTVSDGTLIGQGPDAGLITKRVDLADFTVRAELSASADVEAFLVTRLRRGAGGAWTGMSAGIFGDGTTVRAGQADHAFVKNERGMRRLEFKPGEPFTLEVRVGGVPVGPGRRDEVIWVTTNGQFTAGCGCLVERAGAIGLFVRKGTLRITKLAIHGAPPASKADAPPGAGAAADKKGFVPLFNGQNLDGWRAVNSHAIDWSVEGGVLIGRGHGPEGGANFGQLVTDTAGHANFHLRAEVILSEPQSSSLRFRVGPEDDLDSIVSKGYGVHIEGTEQKRTDAVQLRTGTVRKGGVYAMADAVLGKPPQVRVLPGRWFTLEVIVEGNRFRVSIDGRQVVDCRDPQNSFRAGRIGLVCRPVSIVKYRKIEIRKLP